MLLERPPSIARVLRRGQSIRIRWHPYLLVSQNGTLWPLLCLGRPFHIHRNPVPHSATSAPHFSTRRTLYNILTGVVVSFYITQASSSLRPRLLLVVSAPLYMSASLSGSLKKLGINRILEMVRNLRCVTQGSAFPVYCSWIGIGGARLIRS